MFTCKTCTEMKRKRETMQQGSPKINRPDGPCASCTILESCCLASQDICTSNSSKPYICTVKLFFTALRTMGLVIMYYCFSIGITFYQKWFIQDFHFPLTVVICHLVVKFILSGILRFIWQLCTGHPRILLDWSVYCKQLAPTGIASALDIGFSNWSFEFITVSLYTMTKSTCIIFILGFSLVFGLEKKRCSLVVVVTLIAVGLFMFTYKSTQFNLEGFLLVLSASFLAGLRWTLAQLVMQRKDIGLSNPVDMIYHLQPWMILVLLPLAVVFEGIPIATSEKVFRYQEVEVVLLTLSRILAGALLAFLMELSEYLLLTFTSSLSLSIAGIIKEIFTLYVAVTYSGDQMSTLNFIGLLVCLTGISIHVIMKAFRSQGNHSSTLWALLATCLLNVLSFFSSSGHQKRTRKHTKSERRCNNY